MALLERVHNDTANVTNFQGRLSARLNTPTSLKYTLFNAVRNDDAWCVSGAHSSVLSGSAVFWRLVCVYCACVCVRVLAHGCAVVFVFVTNRKRLWLCCSSIATAVSGIFMTSTRKTASLGASLGLT